MKEKLLSLLGIATRAGKTAMGFDAAADVMKKGRAFLLVLANDLSERTERTIRQTAEQTQTPVVPSGFDMDSLGRAVGRKKTGIIAISDSGFAQTIKAICTENSQEECI